MATFWSKEETLKLLNIWGDANVQEQLKRCRRNRDVYAKIANELAGADYKTERKQDKAGTQSGITLMLSML